MSSPRQLVTTFVRALLMSLRSLLLFLLLLLLLLLLRLLLSPFFIMCYLL